MKPVVNLYTWLQRSFVTLALIPLVFVELLFLTIYFVSSFWAVSSQADYLRSSAKESLGAIVVARASSISGQLEAVSGNVSLLANHFAEALAAPASLSAADQARLVLAPNGVYYTARDKTPGGAAVFYSGIHPVGTAERDKVARLLAVESMMRDLVVTNTLEDQVYLNTFDSLNVIYPYFDVLTQYSPKINIPTFNFYYEADLAHNPLKTPRWTKAYLDPAGKGWVTSAIAPVYSPSGFLEGVAGIDITVSRITTQVLGFEVPWGGYGLVVDRDGTILALPTSGEADWNLSELKSHHYSQALLEDTFKPSSFNLFQRRDLGDFSLTLAESSQGVMPVTLEGGKKLVSWATIGGTDWKYLVVVPESQVFKGINQIFIEQLAAGLVMSLGLLIFYGWFFYLLRRRALRMATALSQPLLQMDTIVSKLTRGEFTQSVPDTEVLELQTTAGHLVELGQHLSDAHAANKLIGEKLESARSDLIAVVNSLDDIILEADETGEITNLWNSDRERFEELPIVVAGEKMTLRTFIVLAQSNHQAQHVEIQVPSSTGMRWFLVKVSMYDHRRERLILAARDITERKILENTLVVARDEAESANRAKSQFLSNMSHELRTPLNAVLGFAQVLALSKKEPLTEAQRRHVREIDKAGQHLLTLINEVLDLARIESGKVSLSLEPIAVTKVLAGVLDLIRPLAERQGLALNVVNLVPDDTHVRADFTKTKQVLINLLSNASKYNRPKGEILFTVEREDQRVKFSVADTGHGIAEADQAKIFQPFQRLNQELTSDIEGTGIGLTVSKQLVNLMEGEIGMQSTLGHGSVFYVYLPLREAPAPVDPAILAAAVKNFGGEGFTVLYIEDNPANSDLVEQIVASLPGTRFLAANRGDLGLELARQHKPNLILLDLHLPGMDGFHVFGELRADEATREIPVFAVTADAMESSRTKALAMGFAAYITKPLNVDSFLEQLTNQMESLN